MPLKSDVNSGLFLARTVKQSSAPTKTRFFGFGVLLLFVFSLFPPDGFVHQHNPGQFTQVQGEGSRSSGSWWGPGWGGAGQEWGMFMG